ncbi:MAG: methyl-accepting chemotaxis sensory transducer with Pas/Pac sensor [Rhodocyclaceae bacterium]|nr:methyl-accepting chemotaxis sensory transducer with Pas/Pac sensor [Rhodocyclaceae bacterium]
MNWFSKLSVQSKLVAGFGVVIALLVIVSATAYRGMSEIQASQQALYEDDFSVAYDLLTLRSNIGAERLDVLVMMESGPVEQQRRLNDLNERTRTGDAILERLVARLGDEPESMAKLNELKALRQQFEETRSTQVVPLIFQGKIAEARALFMGVQFQRQARMTAIATDLEQRKTAAAQHALQRAEQAANTYIASFLVLGVAAILAALILALFLNRTLTGYTTEARKMEAQLKEGSAYTRSLIEASLDPFVTISGEGKIMDVNRATEEATGRTRGQLIGSDFSNYFTEPEKAREGYQHVLAQGFVRDYPLRLRHVSGKVMDVLYNASVFRNQAGEVLGVFAAARDVTERRVLEARLLESSAYTRSLIEASLDPFLTVSPEGKIMDVNRATEEATGLPRDQIIGSDFSNYFTEPDKAREGYQQVLARGFVRDYSLRLRHGSGKVMDVLYNASVFRNEKGEVQGVFAAARDVTERRVLEARLLESSAYTRSLIEASLDPLVTISSEGKIMDVNKATEEATGLSRDQLIGSDFSNYFTEADKARQGYQQVLVQGFVRDYPLRLRHVSGKITDVLYNASVFRNRAGEVQGVFAGARDVTERRVLEARLLESSAYTRSLIEASLDPLVTISAEGKIMDVNKGTELATGQSREILIGSDFSNYFTEPDKARQGYQQALAAGFVRDYPLTLRHTSGRITDVLYNAAVFRNEKGEVQGVFAAARDITERKLLEMKVRERTERLEKVLQEAQEAVNVLTSSSSEILTAIAQLASGAAEAATAVSETTTTVEEVRQTAQQSNQKARDIAEAGQNAALVLQGGQRNVESSVTEMNRIRTQMGSIAETIVTLSEQSQAIGEITGTVNELAEQSNLLAVNAAIEAAKAGEQGKGFAVVAQEIKSLAEQSKHATTQVRGLLADIQKAIGNAVMATEQASKVVETGVTQSSQAGESIRAAVEATVNVAHASTQIAASSQQQMIGVDQVATAMESINQASTQNAQSTRQVESIAQNLHELSQKLKLLVEQFRS